ncbi:MAG TPA: dienelactone hydrolase family protein [Geminicoccaceae bacterium]|nr:dienelactone hydrolase family protein [Geminicoccus sp.]HMU48270.1 dienelactone hydrolase family protein [Geminicoccaceae bacterium]
MIDGRGLDRRRAVAGLAGLALGGLAAPPAGAVLVAPDDARLASQAVEYPGATGMVHGYLVRPAQVSDPLPAVIVVHENRGLHPHIEDVARRVALAGYMALAPDLLSARGGTPDDTDRAREMVAALAPDPVVADLVSAHTYLRLRPDCGARVGALGFAWGGAIVARLLSTAPAIAGGVVFYGRTPPDAEAARIRGPLLLHYAALDGKSNEGLPAFEAALDAAGARYTLHIYEGVNQTFFNDTIQTRYNARAADLAWSRTVDFLKQTLG